MNSLHIITSILGVLALLFILGGPAFHVLPGSNNLWIFAALACLIVGGVVGGFAKKVGKKEGK